MDQNVVTGALPAEPSAFAAALPDLPCWLYARSLLISGTAEVRLTAERDGALVLDRTSAVLVGRPDPGLLREALARNPPGRDLLIRDDALAGVRAALPGWIARPFIVHAASRAYPPVAALVPGVVVSAPLDPAVLDGLPEDVRADALEAPAAAVRVVNETPVALCAVSDATESLWDVGIDTVESARRQGHGTAVFRALATEMAAQGQQPVWAAYEDYAPSLGMAARLGFRPVTRMVELTPPARGYTLLLAARAQPTRRRLVSRPQPCQAEP